jgi:hypothetical protein
MNKTMYFTTPNLKTRNYEIELCVVVDDSSIQRMIIAKLVNNHPNLHLIGDFSNAIEQEVACQYILLT